MEDKQIDRWYNKMMVELLTPTEERKNGEKLCPQLIREDQHRNILPLFHSQQQILTRPKNNIINVKPVICAS